jgi:TolB-like protein
MSMRKRRGKSRPARGTAAHWFVEVVDRPASGGGEGAFMAWLESEETREDEMARCEAAVQIARRLRSDSEIEWAFDEAAQLVTTVERKATAAPGMTWLRNPVLAWSVAGVCAAVAVLAIAHDPLAPVTSIEPAPAGALPANISLALASTEPVVLSPGHVIVDAHSLAILPFAIDIGEAGADSDSAIERLAAGVHRDLVDKLAAISGLYVVGREAVLPYSNADLAVQDIAAQLGARGVVEGTVASGNGRIRVHLRFTDAATNELLFQGAYERPIGELEAIETEMANGRQAPDRGELRKGAAHYRTRRSAYTVSFGCGSLTPPAGPPRTRSCAVASPRRADGRRRRPGCRACAVGCWSPG